MVTFNHALLENGFGAMGLRKRLSRESWLTPNLEILGGRWISNEPIGAYGVGLLWKNIMSS